MTRAAPDARSWAALTAATLACTYTKLVHGKTLPLDDARRPYQPVRTAAENVRDTRDFGSRSDKGPLTVLVGLASPPTAFTSRSVRSRPAPQRAGRATASRPAFRVGTDR